MPMDEDNQSEKLDAEFRRAGMGDAEAFARWMTIVEHPLRRSLARFASAVDAEVVVQETMMRMWLVACDPARRLEGDSASLKFALRVARNVALEELRRTRLHQFVDDEELNRLPEISYTPEPSDPALRKAIRECLERLPEKPKTAMMARVSAGHLPDRDLAANVRMKLNTFLQNIVRARRLLADCLEKHGVRLGEILP